MGARLVLAKATAAVSDLWTRCQVELHGQYSVERMLALDEYIRSISVCRVMYMFFATIVPCLLVIMVLEAFPLAPIEDGIKGSHNFWYRTFIGSFVVTFSIVSQYQLHVHSLRLSVTQTAVISAVTNILLIPILYGLSTVIGYPMPFFVAVSMIPWSPIVVIITGLTLRDQLRRNSSIVRGLQKYTVIFHSQSLLIIVYPTYSYIFTSYPSAQTGLALVLPTMKLIFRNWFGYVSQHIQDVKPELVVFNVEIFSALYVSSCMQSANSVYTTVLLMVVDFLQAWMSIRDLHEVLNEPELRDVLAGLQSDTRKLIPLAMQILRTNKSLRDQSCIRFKSDAVLTASTLSSPRTTAIAPAPQAMKEDANRPSKPTESAIRQEQSYVVGPLFASYRGGLENHDYENIVAVAATLSESQQLLVVQNTLHILHIAEFVALVEYAEVFVPIVYSLFCTIVYRFPNGQYYSTLRGLTPTAFGWTLVNLLAYGSLEFVSFVALDYVLRSKFQLSAFHQVAFVLEKQWKMVQSKLMLWMLIVLQFQLEHYGADFSFKFNWLSTTQRNA